MIKDVKFNFQNVLAATIVLLIFTIFFIILLDKNVNPNPNASDIKTVLTQTLSFLIGFYFGSSNSSKRKDETINDALKDATNKTP